MSQSRFPLHQNSLTLLFPPLLWHWERCDCVLISDIVPCETWRPHFEVLYYRWSQRGEHGREETERWFTILWNWYGNLVMCSFTRLQLWVPQYRNGCVTFQGFTNSHKHCWRRFGQSRCRFVFVCAFRIHRADCKTGDWIIVLYSNIYSHLYICFIGSVKRSVLIRCVVLCFTCCVQKLQLLRDTNSLERLQKDPVQL